MNRSAEAAPTGGLRSSADDPPSAKGPDQQPYTTAVGTSPARAEVPLWVTACTLFDPPPVNAADKVVTAVTFLMASTVRVHGDLAVRLSPTRLALLCGFERPEKSKWLTDYLQKIGFLQIVDGGVNPKTGRRQARRDAKGRPIENEFLVFPEPPAHYCGPRTLAEIDALIAEDIAEAELAHERATSTRSKRSKPRTIPIRQRDLFISAGQAILPSGGMDSNTHPLSRGDGCSELDISAAQPTLPRGGMDSASNPPCRGDGPVSAGQPTLLPGGTYQIDRSSISEREIEGSMEPVPAGTAEPSGPGLEEIVRARVLELGWAEWAERKGLDVANVVSEQDVLAVVRAMSAAMCRAGIDLERATTVAEHALAATKSEKAGAASAYVASAFEAKHLPTWLRRTAAVQLSATPRPLPGAPKPAGPRPASASKKATAPERADTPSSAAPPSGDGKCPGCNAAPGAPRRLRLVDTEGGALAFCPVCCPPSPAGDAP